MEVRLKAVGIVFRGLRGRQCATVGDLTESADENVGEGRIAVEIANRGEMGRD
jgi:hypothetical protein